MYIVLNECKILEEEQAGRDTSTQKKNRCQLKEEQVPVKNPNDVILSDELNDEAAQINALKRKEHTKYRIMKILQCSGRKPSPN